MGKTLFAKCEIATLVRGHLNCAGLARLLFYSPISWTERILSALVFHHMPHLLSLTERLANCRGAHQFVSSVELKRILVIELYGPPYSGSNCRRPAPRYRCP